MNKGKDILLKYAKSTVIKTALVAIFLNLIIELLARFTVTPLGGLLFMFEEPLVFFYNALIIYATLIPVILFKRRIFYISIVSFLWLALGVTNGYILTTRMTPFTTKDLAVIEDGITIVTNYMDTTTIVLLLILALLVVVFFVILFIKAPNHKSEIEWKKSIITVLCSIVLTFGGTAFSINVGLVDTFFGNLAYAYRDYGVPYCFINTWLNTGISKPIAYGTSSDVLELIDESRLNEEGVIEREVKDVDDENPNIIFLQLESFIDPLEIDGLTYSQDPIPFFRSLMDEYSTGKLIVPACGAGTANTEFEVMTGLSVKFFGPGEYPYKSILKSETVENLAYNLGDMGYSTHAIHNHRAIFYNRDEVFSNMGFDTFTSLEYMSNVSKTPTNWAKDLVLKDEILNIMNATEERDYIYTISVQGHGRYPTEERITRPSIEVTSAPSEEAKWQYEYYVNLLYEMDIFIQQLVNELENYDEEVVLVLYGDHIPAIDLTEDVYSDGDLYGTQYVVWSNFDLPKDDKELATYELAAEVLDQMSLDVGTVFDYHNDSELEGEEFYDGLYMLAYDMMYGDKYLYGGVNPFEASDMSFGIDKIVIEEIVTIAGSSFIKGQNFTEFSEITLDGEQLNTIFLGETIIGLREEVDEEDIERMKVSQVDRSSKEIISTTE